MDFKDDLYAILNLPDLSTIQQVKQAYYSLNKIYPQNKHNNISIQINNAYKILSNPTTKKAYDDYLIQKQYNTSTQDLYTKYQNFTKSAADILHTTPDTLFTETLHNDKYYINPKNEPIFTIIQYFNQYRLENAISAIWNRSIFAIFGAALLYTLLIPLSLITKIFHLKLTKHNYTYHWLLFINRQLLNPKPLKTITWSINLNILSILKFFSNFFKTIYWIFKHLIKPFLIPSAIRSLKK